MIDFDKLAAEAQDIINAAQSRAEGLIKDAVAQAKREAETLGRPDLLEWQAKAAAILVDDISVHKNEYSAERKDVLIELTLRTYDGWARHASDSMGGDQCLIGQRTRVPEGKYRLLTFLLPLEK